MTPARRPPPPTRRPLFAAYLCALLALAAPLLAQPLADHVVLVSIDGLRPEFYLDATWPAPNIQHLAREGSRAERARGVFPTVTYPSHTTMVTGALPARHGIHHNVPFDPGTQTGAWYWNASAIRTTTLWEAVRAAGGKTAAVSWPVTVDAPIDWLVPEVWALEGDDRLAPMREHTRPAGLWQEIERAATGTLDRNTFSSDYTGRDLESAAAAAYLLETYRPRLLALHLIGVDHFEHEDGRDSLRVRRSLAVADTAIGQMLEAAERAGILDRTAFVVTGDHGFVVAHNRLRPNAWLAAAGLQQPRKALGERGEWRATFHSDTGSAFLFLRDPADTAALEQVRRILDEQPPRVRSLYRVLDRAALDAAGADPNAALAISGSLGVAISGDADKEPIGAADGGHHGYFPSDFPEIYTGFLAWGAGVRGGGFAHEVGLVDVAPFVARLLDVPFEAPDGLAPLGLLEESP
jgi:predicted AlkP superfamily pyrophosphatase or phosphodiesterase